MADKIEEGCWYTKDHEWVKKTEDGLEVGISDHAQDALGDIVFFDVKAMGETLKAGDSFGVIESVKAVEDLYMPVDGTIAQVNEEVKNNSGTINEKPYEAWLIKITDYSEDQLNNLMNAGKYREFIADQ